MTRRCALLIAQRDRLLSIGTALVGEKALRTVLAGAHKKALYDSQRFAADALLLVADEISLDDLGQLVQKTNDLGTLAAC